MSKFLSIKQVEDSMKVREIFEGQNKNNICYSKKVNLKDFNDIARVLMDLDSQGYPINQAIKKFKSFKKQDFPFW